MPVKHGILKEELIDQHGVTFNFKQKKNMKIKAKKVYCSSIYVIDYFYSRVPLSPEVDRSTTGWHSFKERQSLAADTEIHFVESFRKQELNEFHSICGVTPVTMEWTKRRNITEASGAMVAILQTLSPKSRWVMGRVRKIRKFVWSIQHRQDKQVWVITECY